MKSIPTPIHSYETPGRSYEIENSTLHPQVTFAIHLFKVNDGNIRTKWKVCLKFHRLFRCFHGDFVQEHGFVKKLKRIKILDFIISGCILYTNISRMVIFGLVFLVYF